MASFLSGQNKQYAGGAEKSHYEDDAHEFSRPNRSAEHTTEPLATAEWQALSLDPVSDRKERRRRPRTQADHEEDAYYATLRTGQEEEARAHAERREGLHHRAKRCRVAAYVLAVCALNLLPLAVSFLAQGWTYRIAFAGAALVLPLPLFRVGVPGEYEQLDRDSGDRAFAAARSALGIVFALLIAVSLAALARQARLH